jgi:hypothetical protein
MKRQRNPMARDLLTNRLFRPKQTKTVEERTKQQDRWDRRAKHKSPRSQPDLGDSIWGICLSVSGAAGPPSSATLRSARG